MNVKINLHLDAHTVSLTVPQETEAFYRQAEKMLNERFAYYLRTQPKASAELLWAYVALEVGANLCSDARAKSLEPVEQKLALLNKLIQDNL